VKKSILTRLLFTNASLREAEIFIEMRYYSDLSIKKISKLYRSRIVRYGVIKGAKIGTFPPPRDICRKPTT
jgi:hypothetical protein